MGTHQGSPSLQKGQLIGGCRVIRLLGRGGMGEVYLAEHISLQKLVALKILPPDLGGTDRVERFLKEARTCSRIEHPNVVIIHDVGEQGGLYYIVMQYVQGKNLLELLQGQDGPLPWRSALRLIELAARGLHAVHSRGLVHRDIKPSNIMLSVDSRVLLMDFGLVREELDSSLTRAGQVVGTPSFMSPEQCLGKPLDRRSDVYSLGSTFYCLLAGRPPFRGAMQEVLAQITGGKRPRPVDQLNAEVPPEVSELVSKAMAPRPQNRFDTAALMAREIKRLLKAAQLKSTSTWNTAEISASQVDTQPACEPPPVELLPLQTKWELVRGRLPIIGGVAGIVSCLVMLGLLLHFLAGDEPQPQRPGPPQKAATAGGPGDSHPPPPPSGTTLDKSNMVFIEQGDAQLGIIPSRLTGHIESLPLNDLSKQVSLISAREIMGLEPHRTVRVPAFWIDKYEVTNAEYARFVEASGHEAPEGWSGDDPPSGKQDHPVRNIRHRDAEAYAQWAGKKLPTREQWMRAFRGDNDWLFPWGNQFDPSKANVGENDRFPSTCPVTATPEDKSLFDVFNLEGNVCEYLREEDTMGGQVFDVAKGGSFGSMGRGNGIGPMCTPVVKGSTDLRLGFRCVLDGPQATPPDN